MFYSLVERSNLEVHQMWKETDDFWLTVPETKDGTALLIVLGNQPLRISATYDDDNEVITSRDGHIDFLITSFERDTHTLRGNVVTNDTGHNLSSRTLELTVVDFPESAICMIRKIEGIIF